ncbi:MAG: MATE family efflux transporter [Vampirovibrionales bacterium]|nr:MATE family efflux transporter [Vampirovibrionales bacterium]
MSVKGNFFKGIVLGVGGMGLRTVLNILIMPIIIYYLGVEQYGFYLFLLSFIEMLIMVDMGLNVGLVNRLSVYSGEENRDKAKEQLSVGFWLYLGLSLLMYFAGSFVLPHMTSWFKLSEPLLAMADQGYLIVLVIGAFSLFGNYYQSLVLARHHYHWVQIADLVYLIGSNVLALILLASGHGLIDILLSRLVLIVIRTIALAVCTYKLEAMALFPPFKIRLAAMRELFSISVFSLLLSLSAIFAMRIDNMVIAAHLTMVEVAVFGIVFRLYNMVSEVVDKLTVGFLPLMSTYFSQGDTAKTRLIFIRGTAFLNYVSTALLIWVTVYYEPIFKYFSHNEIEIEPTYQLMWVVAVIVWSRCIVRPADNYLFIFNHRWLVIGGSLIATAANVGLSLLLVKPLGIAGVALGTLIPSVIEQQFFLVLQSCRKLNVSIPSFLKQTYVDVLPALLGCTALIFIGKYLSGPLGLTLGHPYVDMFANGIVAFSVSGIIWLGTAASSLERELILKRLEGYFVKLPQFKACAARLSGRKLAEAKGSQS